ncbi:hypothetical protein AAFN85_05750 [Mucilaginibacter sp. CAU 1740]|uniref:hypothetical protein n=1 Tax=Mucilaginibacter sp. CAU 1740 TaxID=3140365 RepID=UPI00325B20EA
MKIYLLSAGLLLLLISCNQASKTVDAKKSDTSGNIQAIDISGNKPKAHTSKSLKEADTEIADYPDNPPNNGWTDSVLTAYLKNSHNQLVSMSVADTSVNEEWMFDSIRQRGKSKYFVYNVGHDHRDEEVAVFSSDSWVYIDTVTRKLYETQPDESLKEWKQ